MAKNHVYEMTSVYIGATQQTLKNQVFRVRSRIHFSCKHDGEALSTDHNAMFDLKFGFTEAVQIMLKQIVVYLQNKKLRAMTPENAKKWLRKHDPVEHEHIFTSTRTVKQALTLEEMKAELLAKFDGDVDAVKAFLEK